MPQSSSAIEDLLTDLGGDPAPDQLWSIAERCRRLGRHSSCRASFEAAHHVILELARLMDGEPLEESRWLEEGRNLSEIARHLESAMNGDDRAAQILLARLNGIQEHTTH
jgi:hypothetical protein